MYYSDRINESTYTDLMDQLKEVNSDWLELRKSKEYRVGLIVCEVLNNLCHLELKRLFSNLKRWGRAVKSSKIVSSMNCDTENRYGEKSNYFSNDRIAIYTAIFGSYDILAEPYVVPDNCDFYIFTDQELKDTNSVWTKGINLKELNTLSNPEKNRYLKMHPHELFGEYKYSIYIDGNVTVVSDLTEYINKLGISGIGVHSHDSRACVFSELDAILKTKRESKENIYKHREYMNKTGMPCEYGLLQCNVIVREHNNPCCISVMQDWWDEYMNYTKRDQISLPHVLFRHNIKTEDVGCLGKNVYKNPSFRVSTHK